jgi:CRISPR-associated protein Cmr6
MCQVAEHKNPKPIFFLTVGKETKFTFYLFSKNRELLDKVEDWLKNALSNHGIGAKSVGYGYFNVGEYNACMGNLRYNL